MSENINDDMKRALAMYGTRSYEIGLARANGEFFTPKNSARLDEKHTFRDQVYAAFEQQAQEIAALREENARLREAAGYILKATPYPSADDLQVYVVDVSAIEALRRVMEERGS